MKELTIEEKAQRYDEAIKKFDVILNLNTVKESGTIFADDVRKIFPELAESEDEKIRKWLIHYFKEVCDNVSEKEKKGILSWLEKQGEQKPVYHKFRVGDKVKKGYLTYTVEDINEESYKLQAYSKDGDKGSTVFLTIGYEKDYELIEQKSAWSEEDEVALGDALWCCKQAANIAKDENDMGNLWYAERWLKSLKDRYTWKPSDEQMASITCAVRKMKESDCYDSELVSLFNDLKKL